MGAGQSNGRCRVGACSSKAPAGEIYCVGGTGKIKIIDLVEKIGNMCNYIGKIDLRQRAETFKEIEEQWIDSSKLQALGWKPQIDLDEGLTRTINYYRGTI